MSQENVERVREGFAAFARGDLEAMLALLCDDVEWNPAFGPLLGVETITGKEGVKRFLTEELFDGFDAFRAEPLSMEDRGEAVLVATRYAGRGERSGLEIDGVYSGVYWLRDGLAYRFRDYATRQEALDAIASSTDETSPATPPRA